MPKRTSYQPISVESVKRAAIKPHPKNPRQMSEVARSKLDRGLDRFGLLEPIIANRRTGHVLGGHQRLAWLDTKHGEDRAYELAVSWVDVPEKQEPAIIVLLNNETAQGEFELDTLRDLLKSGDLKPAEAELDAITIEGLFPDDEEMSKLFANVPEGIERTVARMQDVQQQRKTRKEENARLSSRNDTETYLIAVFASRAEKEAFLERAGLSKDERYVSAETLLAAGAGEAGGLRSAPPRSAAHAPDAKRAHGNGRGKGRHVRKHKVDGTRVRP